MLNKYINFSCNHVSFSILQKVVKLHFKMNTNTNYHVNMICLREMEAYQIHFVLLESFNMMNAFFPLKWKLES